MRFVTVIFFYLIKSYDTVQEGDARFKFKIITFE